MQSFTTTSDMGQDKNTSSTRSRPHSTPLTLKWLEQNYEIAEGVCIPRSTLYMHYLTFCQTNNTNPVNAASFGKIIRQQFPQISTRRLGTRGQSKYHYYGIGVREGSHYFDLTYSNKLFSGASEVKKDSLQRVMTSSFKTRMTTRLPQFPDVSTIKLPADVEEEKVSTFLVMYRTHCQRVLDAVVRANFDEVQNLLFHFWRGMPVHMVSVLHQDILVKLICVCDAILYKAAAGVLVPTLLQTLPDSLSHVMRKFARDLETWLRRALQGLPEALLTVKFELSRRFSQVLRRQLSLSHLVQASRAVVSSHDVLSQLLSDWMNVDLSSIVKQVLYTLDHYTDKEHALILELCANFEKLLDEQAPIEAYLSWLDRLVQCCVVKASQKHGGSMRGVARQFMLMWSCFGTRIMRDLTLHSAPSFGSFHLLQLLFDEYVLHIVESLHGDERTRECLKIIKGDKQEGESRDDVILPDPAQIKEFFLSTWRSDQGRPRQIRDTRGHNSPRDDIFDCDSLSDDDSSDEEEFLYQPGSADNMSRDISPACMRDAAFCLFPGQQYNHQEQHNQRPSDVNYTDIQTAMTHQQQQNSGVLPQAACVSNSAQTTGLRDYLLQKNISSSQSSWVCQSRGNQSPWVCQSRGVESVGSGMTLKNGYSQQICSDSPSSYHGTYQMSAMSDSHQFSHYPTDKSCQDSLLAFSSAGCGCHGHAPMSQEMASPFLTGSASVKRKHECSQGVEERLRHMHLSKKSSDNSFTGPHQCGIDLL